MWSKANTSTSLLSHRKRGLWIDVHSQTQAGVQRAAESPFEVRVHVAFIQPAKAPCRSQQPVTEISDTPENLQVNTYHERQLSVIKLCWQLILAHQFTLYDQGWGKWTQGMCQCSSAAEWGGLDHQTPPLEGETQVPGGGGGAMPGGGGKAMLTTAGGPLGGRLK